MSALTIEWEDDLGWRQTALSAGDGCYIGGFEHIPCPIDRVWGLGLYTRIWGGREVGGWYIEAFAGWFRTPPDAMQWLRQRLAPRYYGSIGGEKIYLVRETPFHTHIFEADLG